MLLAIMLFTAALVVMARLAPANAEESLGEHLFVTDVGSRKYQLFLYPNLSQEFYLPVNYETRFDVHNFKFWQIEFYELIGPDRAAPPQYNIRQDVIHQLRLDLELSVYTPRGELIDRQRLFRPNWWFTLNHSRTSMEYDRLQVRIRNFSRASRDIRFLALDPVDPVRGTPIPNTRRDIHI